MTVNVRVCMCVCVCLCVCVCARAGACVCGVVSVPLSQCVVCVFMRATWLFEFVNLFQIIKAYFGFGNVSLRWWW